MKKIIILLVCFVCVTAGVSAADLPAEIEYCNLNHIGDEFVYVTQDNKLCYIYEHEPGINDDFEYSAERSGTYFYGVRSLCEGYSESVYFPGKKTKIHRLFIKNDGTLWDYYVENGTAHCDQIKGIENCIKACTGDCFAIALLSDGTVYTWGYRFYGDKNELRYDDLGYASYPEKVEGLENIVDISIGNRCAYALNSDGEVYTWGDTVYSDHDDNVPVKIPGMENCVEIDRGYAYLLGRTNTGEVYQLVDAYMIGFEFPERYYTPVLIKGVDNCIQISAFVGYEEGIMLSADNEIMYYEGSSFDVRKFADDEDDGEEMHRVLSEKFGDPIWAISSGHTYIVMSDSSIWRMIYYANDDHPEYKCAVPANPKDKIKIDSIRFVKRSEAAERISSLYDELTGAAAADTESCTYSDVDTDSKYLSAIGKCCSLGLMNGTDENSFSPNKVLRREQLAVIIDRLLTLTGQDIEARAEKYTDDEAISEWAKESVYKTAELFDRKAGSYSPQEYVSYDELETIIEKVRGV